MKKKVTTFADTPLHVKDFKRFPFRGNAFEQYLLDETSTRELFYISEQMKRIAPMYTDDTRILWIEALRGRPLEWCSFKEAKEAFEIETREEYLREWQSWLPDEVEWYYIVTGYYKDMHYLIIGDGMWDRCELVNRSYTTGNHSDWRYDFKRELNLIGGYIRKVIDRIEKDPEDYYSYISEHLPYNRRTGTISMKDYRNILGEDPWKGIPKTVEPFLRKHARDEDEKTPAIEGEMTIRRYASLWALCYMSLDREGRRADDEYDPIKVFSRSSKGDKIHDYNLDSEEDYKNWFDENSSYHCFDIVYARVHLVPRKEEDGWRLYLYGELEGFTDDLIAVGMALDKAGIPFNMYNIAGSILKDLTSEGRFKFKPLGGFRSDIENPSRRFPYVGDDGITKETLDRLANATTWVPLKKAIPFKEILQEGRD